jgi:methyl-accepting chemotaxis protein
MVAGESGPLLLRPMLAVGDRLRTGMRLALLVIVLLVPGGVATTMYTVARDDQIGFSKAELVGAGAVAPMLAALADTVAGQTPDLGAVRAGAAALGLNDLAAQLPALGDGGPAARLALAQALAALIGEAGNVSNLILDPDLDSFYVMDAVIVQLPKALVAALQAANPSAKVDERAVTAGNLSAAADALGSDVQTAVKNTAMAGMATRLADVAAVQDAAKATARTIIEHLSTATAADPATTGQAAHAAVTPLIAVLSDLLDVRIGAYQRERTVVLVIAIGGFVLAGWFAVAVVRRTTADVRSTVRAVTAIAEGDLAGKPLPGGRDEMGDIGRALAVARDRLEEQDQAIRDAQAAREQQLRSSFRHQRQVEAQFRKRTQTVIDESTGVIAEELRRITDQVGHVRDAAEIIDASITTTDAATAAVVEQARQAEQVISSLEQSLRRVATTAALVTGIAGQTKLLALNATIEAARAGDLGEGFTVVADEVKELATNTARSTQQITETISDLERETAEMARTITTMIEGIASVGDAANSLRAVTADQDSLVDELSGQMTGTLSRVEQMSNLAAQLERRDHERISASGAAKLAVPGKAPVPVTTINISAGGLRCTVPLGVSVREGDSVSVELAHGQEHLSVHAKVVNTAAGEAGAEPEIGLQFLVSDDALAGRLSSFVQGVLDNAAALHTGD